MRSTCFVQSGFYGRDARVGRACAARIRTCAVQRRRTRVIVSASFLEPLASDVGDEELVKVVDDLRIAPSTERIEPAFAYSLLDQLRMGKAEFDELAVDVFRTLQNRKILTSFGAFENRHSPGKDKAVSVTKFAEETGIPMSALSPKKSTLQAWQFAGVGVAVGTFFIARLYHVDMYATAISLGAIGAFALDQAFLRGSIFEAIYRSLFPEYREKILKHEAGHLLLAYLLGCPIRGYVIDAYDALLKGIPGQAGTIFTDPRLQNELQNNKLTQKSIDRYSIVVMGGIAAEALEYGQAEGGQSDEVALVSLLAGLRPAWYPDTILNQARWSAQSAILLLRYQRTAYEALVECMRRGAPLGECVRVIEENIRPPEVPVEPAQATASDGSQTSSTAEKQPEQPKPTKEEFLKGIADREKDIDSRLAEIDRMLGDMNGPK